MTDKKKVIKKLKEALDSLDITSNLRLILIQTIEYLQEEPVSEPIDFEKELYKAFGQVKDFTLGMRIAKRFYDMGKNSHEPVSEELEEAALMHFKDVMEHEAQTGLKMANITSFKAGAQWKEQRLMQDATEQEVMVDDDGFPYIDVKIELYNHNEEFAIAEKVKVLVIKEK